MNPWLILGIRATDDIQTIKAAYAQCIQLHPPDQESEDHELLNQAYLEALAWHDEVEIAEGVSAEDLACVRDQKRWAELDAGIHWINKQGPEVVNNQDSWDFLLVYDDIENPELKSQVSQYLFSHLAQMNHIHMQNQGVDLFTLNTMSHLNERFGWTALGINLNSSKRAKGFSYALDFNPAPPPKPASRLENILNRLMAFGLDAGFALLVVYILKVSNLIGVHQLLFCFVWALVLPMVLLELSPWRASLGKRLIRVRIRQDSDAPVTMARVFVRSVLFHGSVSVIYLWLLGHNVFQELPAYMAIFLGVFAVLMWLVSGRPMHDEVTQTDVY